ncbi:quinoprotein relay system zinc metallohydrolase 2 [Roseicella aquatilis]|uniref:Quinoprotein relay system zinc metallohydrolase 2 n=1 Tax=Roseicella aquatilis TaxID=2527868 RepID=A0A4R4DUV8_9PROT|nr:quinoprotein relay system zinc metallohydrolase 2 [Roseicella aquatilis]TCZ64904.1 quinoprotein relay system zinc metallohydrolase 2 [Roseicella aquatilis]
MSAPRRAILLAGLGALAAGAASGAASAVEVAPGLFVLPGLHEEASADNLDAIGNVGFVVGREAVAVVDPGGSLAHGQHLRRAIAAATPLPIRHIVLTHVHPDHVMGGAAFADCGAEVIGHARLPEALAQRHEFYGAMLAREMGAAAAGSAALAPTRLVAPGQDEMLELGGRALRLTAHPPAHTDHDLSLFDAATGTLWLSDLLFVERIPSLDGSLPGWRRVLEGLARWPGVMRAVPGHGPPAVDWPAAAAPLARYLDALERETRAAIATGIGLAEAPARVATAEAAGWRLAEAYHGRNVTAAYRELEWE